MQCSVGHFSIEKYSAVQYIVEKYSASQNRVEKYSAVQWVYVEPFSEMKHCAVMGSANRQITCLESSQDIPLQCSEVH